MNIRYFFIRDRVRQARSHWNIAPQMRW